MIISTVSTIKTNYGVFNALTFCLLNYLDCIYILSGNNLSIISDPIKIPTKKYITQYPNNQYFSPKINDNNLPM